MTRAALETAAALFTAIESGNAADVAALYADDIAVWHNFDNREQSKTDNLMTLTGLITSTAGIHYRVIERLELPDGRVLQRHELEVHTADGRSVVIPACILLTIRDGLITRIDEYLDTGQTRALRRKG